MVIKIIMAVLVIRGGEILMIDHQQLQLRVIVDRIHTIFQIHQQQKKHYYHRIIHYHTLCASHDVGQHIVRRQAVSLSRCPVKIVGMGLATTNRLFRIGCHLNGIGGVRVAWRDGSLRVE